jgi:hypothetical protein
MDAATKKRLLIRWLLLFLFSLVIPLPYYTPMVSGVAPLWLLLTIALGDFFAWEIVVLNFSFSAAYFVILYLFSGLLSYFLTEAGTTARNRALAVLAIVLIPVVLSPVYGLGITDIKYENLYEFTRTELAKAHVINWVRPRPPSVTRVELLARPGTVVHADIAIGYIEISDHVAWWKRVFFIPMGQSIRGIPAKQIDSSWHRVSELRKGLVPDKLISGKTWDPEFSVEGDFNLDGRSDVALIGVYEAESGHLGTFMLVLTRMENGELKKEYLEDFGHALGIIGIVARGNFLELSSCPAQDCEPIGTLVWDRNTVRYRYSPPGPMD